MNLKGSKTEQNLMAAFAGESQARNKYTYYASKAKKEGFNQIADLFRKQQTMKKNMRKFGLSFFTTAKSPIRQTNLKDAAAGENYEWTDMYARICKGSKEEGFDKIAYLFEAVGKD